jgi:hypothetical protein
VTVHVVELEGYDDWSKDCEPDVCAPPPIAFPVVHAAAYVPAPENVEP